MKENKEKRIHRAPTVFEAYFTIGCMLFIIGVGNGVMGFDLKMMLVVCTAVNMLIAWRCGAGWDRCQNNLHGRVFFDTDWNRFFDWMLYDLRDNAAFSQLAGGTYFP